TSSPNTRDCKLMQRRFKAERRLPPAHLGNRSDSPHTECQSAKIFPLLTIYARSFLNLPRQPTAGPSASAWYKGYLFGDLELCEIDTKLSGRIVFAPWVTNDKGIA